MLFVPTSVPRFVATDKPKRVSIALRFESSWSESQTVYRVGILQVLKSDKEMRVIAQVDTLAGVRRAVERCFKCSPTH
jgi:hypothetical protein